MVYIPNSALPSNDQKPTLVIKIHRVSGFCRQNDVQVFGFDFSGVPYGATISSKLLWINQKCISTRTPTRLLTCTQHSHPSVAVIQLFNCSSRSDIERTVRTSDQTSPPPPPHRHRHQGPIYSVVGSAPAQTYGSVSHLLMNRLSAARVSLRATAT